MTRKEEIIKSGQELRQTKLNLRKEKNFLYLRKSRILIPGILILLVILACIILFLNHHSKVRWAKEKVLPEIEQLINE